MSILDIFLKTVNQLQIDQPWSKPLWHGIGNVRKVFYKQIGDRIFPVNHVENFKGGPYIFKFAKRIMTSAVRLIIVQQESTKTDIGPYIRLNDQSIAVFHATRNTI